MLSSLAWTLGARVHCRRALTPFSRITFCRQLGRSVSPIRRWQRQIQNRHATSAVDISGQCFTPSANSWRDSGYIFVRLSAFSSFKWSQILRSVVMFRVLIQAQQAKGGEGHCDSVCEGDRKEFCGYRWTGQSIVDRLARLDSKFVTTTAVDDQTVLRTQTGE